MKRLHFFAFSLAGALAAAPARALPQNTEMDVHVANGPSMLSMGSVFFALSAQVPGGACRYGMRWVPPGSTLDATCSVDEAKWLGARSCAQNAQGAMHSIVIRAPGASCAGFDIKGFKTDVFQLVLGERAGDPSMVGLIQYSPASPSLYGFRVSTPIEPAMAPALSSENDDVP